MQQKDLFEKYFKLDFLMIANDRVSNVRIALAKVLRHHFLKEISGAFVYDKVMNDCVRVLKLDKCEDVRSQVADIEAYPVNDQRVVTMESFLKNIEEIKLSQNWSDSDSSFSEDEQRIENEIRRHNSEDEIDHGPVLESLRKARQQQFDAEAVEKKLMKQEKKKEKDVERVHNLLDEATGDDNEKQIDSSKESEEEKASFDEDD